MVGVSVGAVALAAIIAAAAIASYRSSRGGGASDGAARKAAGCLADDCPAPGRAGCAAEAVDVAAVCIDSAMVFPDGAGGYRQAALPSMCMPAGLDLEVDSEAPRRWSFVFDDSDVSGRLECKAAAAAPDFARPLRARERACVAQALPQPIVCGAGVALSGGDIELSQRAPAMAEGVSEAAPASLGAAELDADAEAEEPSVAGLQE